ncbi:hypothetical protein M9458_051981 [Cirrhinus mrigala]|uniref:Uncharacterized protein n=1 Tax=Cirrhinus mrigala TaxID=683832 RepID=A0ABD0MQD0_CIRMR
MNSFYITKVTAIAAIKLNYSFDEGSCWCITYDVFEDNSLPFKACFHQFLQLLHKIPQKLQIIWFLCSRIQSNNKRTVFHFITVDDSTLKWPHCEVFGLENG